MSLHDSSRNSTHLSLSKFIFEYVSSLLSSQKREKFPFLTAEKTFLDPEIKNYRKTGCFHAILVFSAQKFRKFIED